MRFGDDLTDSAVLVELGTRLAAQRVRADLSQADLSAEAGVSVSTVKRLEAGTPVSTERLVRVLRVLRLLEGLEVLVPETAVSPLELFDNAGRRRRVRHPAGGRRASSPEPWTWDDD